MGDSLSHLDDLLIFIKNTFQPLKSGPGVILRFPISETY